MKYNMRQVSIVIILLLNWTAINAQTLQGQKSATHFFMVNLDADIAEVLSAGDAVKNVSVYSLSSNGMITSIIDTFYQIAEERFKAELGLELLPLGELKNKIRYNKDYPLCPDMPNIKKVLKTASGYKFYLDYYVNVFSDLYQETMAKPTPARIRPLFAICFTLYNASGIAVEKVEYSYKTRKPLAQANLSTDKSCQQIKTRLCEYYSEALEGFSVVCRKKLTAQL